MGGCPKFDCLLVDGHDDSHWLADDQRKWENIMDKVEIGILQFPPSVRSKVWPHAMPLYSNEFVKFAKELERKANPNWAIDELPLEDINSVINRFLIKKKLDNK